MELKDLVPPMELCKQIPEGKFEYSALVWSSGYIKGNYVISQRGYGFGYIAPAPTLAEIMTDLTEFQPAIVAFWLTRAEVQCWGDQIEEAKNAKSTTAALKLWLKMKE